MPSQTKYATSVFTDGWTNSSNAYTDDSSYAETSPIKNSALDVYYSGFGFTIPSDAIIYRILAEYEYHVSTQSSLAIFASHTHYNGADIGNTYQDTSEPLSDTIRQNNYAVTTLTPTKANTDGSGGMAVLIRGSRGNSDTAVTFYLDFVRLTIWYYIPYSDTETETPPVDAVGTSALVSVTVGHLTDVVEATGIAELVAPVPSGAAIGTAELMAYVDITKAFLHDASSGYTDYTTPSNNPPYDPFLDYSVGHTEDHAPTITGATITTVRSKFGGGCGLFDDALEKVTYPDSDDWHFGINPFTISYWVYWEPGVPAQFHIQQYVDSNNFMVMWSIPDKTTGAGQFELAIKVGGSFAVRLTKNSLQLSSGWNHIEYSRGSSSGYIFLNGAKQTLDTNTYNGNCSNLATVLSVGWVNFANASCYVDEIKIDKGICRHTADFTPPTGEDIDNDGYTVLYLKCNYEIPDDVILLPDPIGEDDAFYFLGGFVGDLELYGLYVNVTTAGDGTYTLAWEYYNGSSWTSLVEYITFTGSLPDYKTLGINKFDFRKPSDISDVNVNGFLGEWIRARYVSGTETVQPKASRIYVYAEGDYTEPPAPTFTFPIISANGLIHDMIHRIVRG